MPAHLILRFNSIYQHAFKEGRKQRSCVEAQDQVSPQMGTDVIAEGDCSLLKASYDIGAHVSDGPHPDTSMSTPLAFCRCCHCRAATD